MRAIEEDDEPDGGSSEEDTFATARREALVDEAAAKERANIPDATLDDKIAALKARAAIARPCSRLRVVQRHIEATGIAHHHRLVANSAA